jgi:hypothetical protein
MLRVTTPAEIAAVVIGLTILAAAALHAKLPGGRSDGGALGSKPIVVRLARSGSGLTEILPMKGYCRA